MVLVSLLSFSSLQQSANDNTNRIKSLSPFYLLSRIANCCHFLRVSVAKVWHKKIFRNCTSGQNLGISVTRELILLYWRTGKVLSEKANEAGWGSKTIEA